MVEADAKSWREGGGERWRRRIGCTAYTSDVFAGCRRGVSGMDGMMTCSHIHSRNLFIALGPDRFRR